jgi:hypothetical protein
METDQTNTGATVPMPPASKQRNKILLLVILTLLGCALLYASFVPREPVYHGRSLSSWLNELSRSFDQGGGQSAEAIRSIGTNALPRIIIALRTRDTKTKVKLSELFRRLNLIKFPFSMAHERRDEALKALMILGADAKIAIPELSGMLDNPELSPIAANALFAIGTNSIPALAAACGHTNLSVRAHVAFVLSKLTFGGGGYTTSYIPSGTTNKVYCFSLTLGDNDIAALALNLNDPHPAVRRASAEALSGFSGIAEPAIPALVNSLRDENPGVREAAAAALKRINPKNPADDPMNAKQ